MKTFEAWEIYDHWTGRLTPAQKRLITYLDDDGYLFTVNDNRLMDCAKKWQDYDLLTVANSQSKPRHLWAIKPRVINLGTRYVEAVAR